jgi:hypothetical protein
VLVELEVATTNAVSVEVVDESGLLLGATSGHPGDGASAEPYVVTVTNDSPTILRLAWVGGPCDGRLTLSIDATGRRFRLVQPECAGDAVVHDRVLLARFARQIAAGDVEAILQDGIDTSEG